MDIHKQKGNLILSHLGDCLKENHLQKLFSETFVRQQLLTSKIALMKNVISGHSTWASQTHFGI